MQVIIARGHAWVEKISAVQEIPISELVRPLDELKGWQNPSKDPEKLDGVERLFLLLQD